MKKSNHAACHTRLTNALKELNDAILEANEDGMDVGLDVTWGTQMHTFPPESFEYETGRKAPEFDVHLIRPAKHYY